MIKKQWIGVGGAVLLLGGCAVGPDYQRPLAYVPERFQGKTEVAAKDQHQWRQATPQDHQERGQWWQIFQDAELDRLEQLALKNNYSLAVALAQRDQAQAGRQGFRLL